MMPDTPPPTHLSAYLRKRKWALLRSEHPTPNRKGHIMNKRESAQAQRLLADDDWCERTERCGLDDGFRISADDGWCVTAHWRDGGQKLFCSLDDVRRSVVNAATQKKVDACRRRAAGR